MSRIKFSTDMLYSNEYLLNQNKKNTEIINKRQEKKVKDNKSKIEQLDKNLKKIEAEYEKWKNAPEGDDRQSGNSAYWAPGKLKSAFSVDSNGNGTWTPGYGPRRQPASAANNYNDGPLEGFHPEVVFMAPAGSLAAIPEGKYIYIFFSFIIYFIL